MKRVSKTEQLIADSICYFVFLTSIVMLFVSLYVLLK